MALKRLTSTVTLKKKSTPTITLRDANYTPIMELRERLFYNYVRPIGYRRTLNIRISTFYFHVFLDLLPSVGSLSNKRLIGDIHRV